MNAIITPSAVVEIVLQRKTNDFRLRFYETFTQKLTFLGTVALMTAAVCAGIVFMLSRIEWIGRMMLICSAASSLGAMLYQIAQLIPEFRKMRNPEREFSSPLVKTFNDDLDLIHELASSFELHHLSYAKAMYGHMAKQIRERIGLLVGALDKVGLIPVAVTAYLSYTKAVKEGISFGPYEMTAIAFAFLYLLAIRLTATAQWMEHVSEIYSHAYARRLAKTTDERKP